VQSYTTCSASFDRADSLRSPLGAAESVIACEDSFDWPVYPTAVALATLYQLENQNPSFGQDMSACAKRLAAPNTPITSPSRRTPSSTSG
jgi:hypothetical protein